MVARRIELALAAARRWSLRESRRADSIKTIGQRGVGSADSVRRQMAFAVRESRLRALGEAGGQALFGQERVIGPTADFSQFPPSEAARQAGRPVARIVAGFGPGLIPYGVGSGFLVSPRLLLTNHHVLQRAEQSREYAANLGYDLSDRGQASGEIFELDPDAFFLTHEGLDYTLVAVKPRGLSGASLAGFGFCPLVEATPKILIGQPVNIIQHPAGGPKQYVTRNNPLLDVLDDGFLHYATDTAEGSSGSPGFSRNWEVVTLHHSGIPEIRNGQIMNKSGQPWDPEKESPDNVHWIANEGIRVSAVVGSLRNTQPAGAGQAALLAELMAATIDPTQKFDAPESAGGDLSRIPTSSGGPMANNVFNITGNVTFHIYAPSDALRPPSAAAAAPADLQPTVAAPEKKQNLDRDYAGRKGYDADFLGSNLPLPGVQAEALTHVYSVQDYLDHCAASDDVPAIDVEGLDPAQPCVLAYHHFSLVMNKTRRLVLWTASNADYRDASRDDRPRAAFGTEDWAVDPRLPVQFQMTDPDFYKPATRIDRGHLVRRDDNCWGQTPLEVEFANADSYHWTNCTPQHELFNQESPRGREYAGRKGIWGQFEQHIAKQIRDNGGRATLFAGPVLRDTDPAKDFGDGPVQYPLKFWKVVVVPTSTSQTPVLAAYAFLFDQTRAIKEFGLLKTVESIDVTAFDRQRTTLEAIEELTGVSFPAALRQAERNASAAD